MTEAPRSLSSLIVLACAFIRALPVIFPSSTGELRSALHYDFLPADIVIGYLPHPHHSCLALAALCRLWASAAKLFFFQSALEGQFGSMHMVYLMRPFLTLIVGFAAGRAWLGSGAHHAPGGQRVRVPALWVPGASHELPAVAHADDAQLLAALVAGPEQVLLRLRALQGRQQVGAYLGFAGSSSGPASGRVSPWPRR